MALVIYTGTITTTGSAGSATGSATVNLDQPGYLEWIYYDFSASAPATSDTTLAHGGTPAGNILVVTNSVTDVRHYPRAGVVDSAASAITNSHTRHALTADPTISIAQCDALAPALTYYMCVEH